MLSFSFWVVIILLSIVAIPVAASLEKRKLRAQIAAATSVAMSEAEESSEASSEEEAKVEEPVASMFDVEPDGTETR